MNFEYRVWTLVTFSKILSHAPYYDSHIIENETVEFENEKLYQNYFQERFYAESKGESLSTRSIEKASSKIVSLPNKILSHLENVREPIINRGLHPQLRLQEARRMQALKRDSKAHARFEVIVEIIGLAVETFILYDP